MKSCTWPRLDIVQRSSAGQGCAWLSPSHQVNLMAKGQISREPNYLSRRAFLSAGFAMPLVAATLPSRNQSIACATARSSPSEVMVTSPDGILRLAIFLGDQGRLHYRVTFHDIPVIEPCAMGMTVDDIDL